MAVLTGPTVRASGGGVEGPKWVVLYFPRVTSGDTFDFSTLSSPFVTLNSAVGVPASTGAAVTVALAGITGTVATFTETGLANHALLVFAVGN